MCDSETEGKGKWERLVLCTYVGSLKKDLFCCCRIYILYQKDTPSKDSCQAGCEGEPFSILSPISQLLIDLVCVLNVCHVLASSSELNITENQMSSTDTKLE